MQPLNPFLAAFFKSSLPSQCSNINQHILLVPTTEVLLTFHDLDAAVPLHEHIASEEFLASHVLRIQGAGGGSGLGGKDGIQNLRDLRGKVRQYSTLNGRGIVIKDGYVYSNKGFKAPNEALLLHDALWYPDALEPRPWLVYYISRPLIGIWREIPITPAILPTEATISNTLVSAPVLDAPEGSSTPHKRNIIYFHDLLNHFPLIAKHLQPGLEKLFREFTKVFERPLPPPPSASTIPDPEPDGPITAAIRRARSRSIEEPVPNTSENSGQDLLVNESFYAEDDEDVMRASLETAVMAAIDLFQSVDKSQLAMLSSTTNLTGPAVEKLIERYVAENVHHVLFPRLCTMQRSSDLELEAKIRQMDFIDISQLGIKIEGGSRGRHELVIQLGPAVEEFRKMAQSSCPQEMLNVLLSTVKTVSQITETKKSPDPATPNEKPVLTLNADTLVSLLLFVVIRAQVRHLQARLVYIRNFIFIDDVDSGEMGYALSTFEAVLAYLVFDSAGLRRASRRNKVLWDAAAKGDMEELRTIMEPTSDAVDRDDLDTNSDILGTYSSGDEVAGSWGVTTGSSKTSRRSSLALTDAEKYSKGSDLTHVFPFQLQKDTENVVPDPIPIKRIKRVAMDTRSLSSGSDMSYRSRATSIGTINSSFAADISAERISQTRNSFGESILMMAIQHEQVGALRYFLGLRQYFPADFVLDDVNNEETTLLSASIQLGNTEIIDTLLDYVSTYTDDRRIKEYFSAQDIWDRSLGHYLFHAPDLITRIGSLVPWRQRDKNGQTPLLALCRSYDQTNYQSMVSAGLEAARRSQGDGEPLHLDDHVDGKGNTLLHVVNDVQLIMRILQHCDVDVNATNERKFTALMVASKYGRYDMVRALYNDPRVDPVAKEIRGLTAVELAKDDDIRNKIDDLALFSTPAGPDDRITSVVRAFFVEDGTVRLVLKSAAPADNNSYTVTTCRRSTTDFETLANLLALENPASWVPAATVPRSPFQIPSKPSRAVLRENQIRADWFLRIMLVHPTFATHEMLWEFFLLPDIRLDQMAKRSHLKADTLAEKIRDEMEPVEDVREVDQFVEYSRDMIRGVHYSTKGVMRRSNNLTVTAADLYDATAFFRRAATTIAFLPPSHKSAIEIYTRAFLLPQGHPHATLHSSLLALHSTMTALLTCLSRPPSLITKIRTAQKTAERNYNALNRSSRWPLGLLDDARQRLNDEREDRARKSSTDVLNLSKELRYTQQVVAGDLAGWQDLQEKMVRGAIREFARGMVVFERVRLDGMVRALRKVRQDKVQSDDIRDVKENGHSQAEGQDPGYGEGSSTSNW